MFPGESSDILLSNKSALQPVNQATGNLKEVCLRNDTYQLSVLDHRQAADHVFTHEGHGLMEGGIWIDDHRVLVHDILSGADIRLCPRIMVSQFKHIPEHHS